MNKWHESPKQKYLKTTFAWLLKEKKGVNKQARKNVRKRQNFFRKNST